MRSATAALAVNAVLFAAGAQGEGAEADVNMTRRCIPAGAPEMAGSCLDGSPYCFYERLNASSSSWAFFFEGGGACENAQACVQRGTNGGGLGSSKNMSATRKPFKVGDLVDGWNLVYLPYCDGSVWKGTMTKPRTVPRMPPPPNNVDQEAVPAPPNQYLACGHYNAAATLRTLLADTAAGFATATHVIVSGGSAGGIGAFTHADYVRELPELSGADVRAAPYCGWFYPDVAAYPAWEKNKSAGISWDYIRGLNEIWSDAGECYADASCKRSMPEGEAYKCGTMDVLYQHIECAEAHARNLIVVVHKNSRTNPYVRAPTPGRLYLCPRTSTTRSRSSRSSRCHYQARKTQRVSSK